MSFFKFRDSHTQLVFFFFLISFDKFVGLCSYVSGMCVGVDVSVKVHLHFFFLMWRGLINSHEKFANTVHEVRCTFADCFWHISCIHDRTATILSKPTSQWAAYLHGYRNTGVALSTRKGQIDGSNILSVMTGAWVR